jgi:hypothetical protein
MRIIMILFLFPLIINAQKTALWETKFYLEDAVGNKDSVILGFDEYASSVYNPEFGEVNIKNQPWDSVFEVRASHNEPAHYLASPKVLSKKIIGHTEGGLNPLFHCLDVRENLKMFVKIKHYPLKISWDSLRHQDFCNKGNYITPHFLPSMFIYWYRDPEFVQDPPYVCLAEHSSFTINNFHTNNNGFVDYIIDIESDGKIDSIFALVFYPHLQDLFLSPCRGTVDTKDVPDKDTMISVYPNPGNHTLTVSVSDGVVYPLRYQLHSVTGQQVMTGTMTTPDYTSVDTDWLPAGMYIIAVTDKQGKNGTAKWVKQ